MAELTIQYDDTKEPFVHFVDKELAPLAAMALADRVAVEYETDDEGNYILTNGKMVELHTVQERAVMSLSKLVNGIAMKYQTKNILKAATDAGQIKTVTVTGEQK